MDLGASLIALLTAGVVKVCVMIFGGWLVYALYGATHSEPGEKPWLLLPKDALPELRLLWWSLVLFCVGEATCGIEIYVIFRSSPWFSGIHALSSAFGMALFSLGAYLHLDKKLLRYGERGCHLNRICQGCAIATPAGCKFRRVLYLSAVFLILAAMAPFFAPTERMFADLSRWALPIESWNAWYDHSVVPWLQANVAAYDPSGAAYSLPPSMLVIEFRLLPSLALVLALISIPLARIGQETRAAKVLVFAAGILSYCYFELVLYRVTGDVLIGSLAHEIVEFWFLIAVFEFLRSSFPRPDAGA
jgi:hypothetical protein